MLSSSLIGWRPGVGGVGARGRGGGALATLHAPVEKKTLVFLCVFFFARSKGSGQYLRGTIQSTRTAWYG